MIQVEQADASSGPTAESAQSPNPRTFLSDVRIVPEALNGASSPAPTGIITLYDPAPPGGVMVDLASDQPTLVVVPGKPLIPEGAVATFFEPIITSAATVTRAVITASVGQESTSAEIRILPGPHPSQIADQDANKEQLASMPTHTDIGPPPANGTAAAPTEANAGETSTAATEKDGTGTGAAAAEEKPGATAATASGETPGAAAGPVTAEHIGAAVTSTATAEKPGAASSAATADPAGMGPTAAATVDPAGVAAETKAGATGVGPRLAPTQPQASTPARAAGPRTVEERVAQVFAQLANVKLEPADQPIVAGIVRALDDIVTQRMFVWLGDVELATWLLLADPPQVAAVSAIRTNLDKKLNQRTAIALLRRNTTMGNVALGLATLVLGAAVVVGLLVANLHPGTKIAGIDATVLLLVSVAGALGSVVSVMYRIDSFDQDPLTSPLGAYFTGLFKPIIGVGFGLFVYFALASKVITLAGPTGDTEPYFYAALGFLAGFVEKLAPDLIAKAAGTIDSAGNAPTGGPSAPTAGK